MDGKQVVVIDGYLKKPYVKKVGPYDGSLFTGIMEIPASDGSGNVQTLKISTFSCADEMGELKSGTPLHIEGHLEVKKGNSSCQQCGTQKPQYYTNIVVDRFNVLN